MMTDDLLADIKSINTQISLCASRKQRKLLRYKRDAFISQNGKCVFCKCRMTCDQSQSVKQQLNYCSVEHVTPRSDGGSDDKENIVASCVRCNNSRRVVDYDAWVYVCSFVNYENLKVIGRTFDMLKIKTLGEVVDFFMNGHYKF